MARSTRGATSGGGFDMAEPATAVPPDASRDVPNAVDVMLAPIRELGLEPYVAELEQYGYTVIPPERVATPEFVERLRDAVLRVAHERTGVEHARGRLSPEPGPSRNPGTLPRARCGTRERRVRGRPAPGRAPPRPRGGRNSMLAWRDRRRGLAATRGPATRRPDRSGRGARCSAVRSAVPPEAGRPGQRRGAYTARKP